MTVFGAVWTILLAAVSGSFMWLYLIRDDEKARKRFLRQIVIVVLVCKKLFKKLFSIYTTEDETDRIKHHIKELKDG